MTDPAMAVVDPQPLNDDVLSVIFTFLPDRTRSSFHSVLAASHVCTQWRLVSVHQTPEVWRRYAFLSSKRDGKVDPQFAEEILGRCGALTLDVGWEWEHEPYAGTNKTATDAILAYTPHAHRLRSYSLLLPKERTELLRAQVALNTWNPVHMQELSVRERVQGDRIRRFFEGIEIDLPSLRKLTLHRCWIELDRISFRNLQSFTGILSSAGPMTHEGFPSTFHGWLKYLRNWPRLSALRLQLLSPTPDLVAWRMYQAALTEDLQRESRLAVRVSLHHLTDIHVSLYYHDLEILLDNVSLIPARKAVFHVYASRPGRLHGLQERVRELVTKHAGPSRSRANRMTVSVSADGSACGVGFSKRKEYGMPLAGHYSEEVAIHVHALQTNGAYEPIKTYLLPLLVGWALVLRRITSLRIDAAPEALPDDFKKTFHSLLLEAGELETLFCRKDVVPKLVRRHSLLTDVGNGHIMCKLVLPMDAPPPILKDVARRRPLNLMYGHEFRIVTYE